MRLDRKEMLMEKGFSGGLMMAFMLTGACVAGGENLGVTEGKLAPCPDSPNCVSTQSQHKGHAMKPLPYLGSQEASREMILSILKGMKRAKIIKLTPSYIHAEFTTAVWHFVDDVEFLLDDTARVVHFRSASRVGHYDFGLNRRRMTKISVKWVNSTLGS
jgi:uncharacterized protein (DUF1499 family)